MFLRSKFNLVARHFATWRSDVPYDKNVLDRNLFSGPFLTFGSVDVVKEELHTQIFGLVRTSTLTSRVKLFSTEIHFGHGYQVTSFTGQRPSGGKAENQEVELKAIIARQTAPSWFVGIPVGSEHQTNLQLDILVIGGREIARLMYQTSGRKLHPEDSVEISGEFNRLMLLNLLSMREEPRVYSSRSDLTTWFLKNRKHDK